MTDSVDRPIAAVPGLGPGALVIERVETVALRAPLGRRFQGSAYSMNNRCTIVTRLFTADGLVSEVYTGDTDAEQALIVGIIHNELAPQIIGRSAADPEGVWRAMEPSTNDILRDRGLALQAIACVDTAIWDLFGQALGLPLHRVWGCVSDTLPISVIGGYYHLTGDSLGATMASYVKAGFGGVKFKVGGTGSRSRAAGQTTDAGCATSATRPGSLSAPARARPPCAGSAT